MTHPDRCQYLWIPHGPRCCLGTGHPGVHQYLCAGPYCPGARWPASLWPHPRACWEPITTQSTAGPAKVRAAHLHHHHTGDDQC